MPVSDQWNGDDELPKSEHGSLADESRSSVSALSGENVLNTDLNEARQTDDVFDGEEEKPEDGGEPQGDANKADQGKTTAEREEDKAERAEDKEAKEAEKATRKSAKTKSVE